MSITPEEIKERVERELSTLHDPRVTDQIRNLLVKPEAIVRDWDYGEPGEAYVCWSVLDHPPSNSGIAFCEEGFGPRAPWGLVTLGGPPFTSIGMDCFWLTSFLTAFFESKAACELPIWQVFRQVGKGYPGIPVTEGRGLGHHLGDLPEEGGRSGAHYHCYPSFPARTRWQLRSTYAALTRSAPSAVR
jgi:hypothetical protein